VEEEIEWCAEAWLRERGGFTFRLFSQLRPLDGAEEKRYFIARQDGRMTAFVACSPIYARSGWYIEDIIRVPGAAYGTTELLVTTALDCLRDEGYSMATLGLSPFADLRRDEHHPGRTRVLGAILAALGPFYNMRGYQHYKKKFAPTWFEPVYVAFRRDRVSFGLLWDLANAVIPGGSLGLARRWMASGTRSAMAVALAPVLAARGQLPREK